ncbi:MAG TPA: prepilin-type N-terminal cleavage/methylation domain-containing protein [Dehalococcoidia bacterium]|nr:prepilin-type N-terminal cleavage/methylation domain-containing protein [Dehalococcoidia bacterium]
MKCKRLVHGKNGFTLIEMMVTLAITSIIGVGAAAASYHVLNQSASNNDHTSASQHALNAVHWISRDVQMAQTVSPEGASGFPLTLQWVGWDNTGYEVVYTIDDGTLRRSYSADGELESEVVVAQYIDPDVEMTSCEFSDGVLTLKITTTVGEGSHAESVSKVREITPRPGL